jgi:hypothetical protein
MAGFLFLGMLFIHMNLNRLLKTVKLNQIFEF